MQISARWVLPVTSIGILRNSRSSSHGGGSAPRHRVADLVQRDFQFGKARPGALVDARRLARSDR